MSKGFDMRRISPHTQNSIGFAIKYYHQYVQQCDNLAKRANELVANTHLADCFLDDISCEYQPSNGLVFVMELDDGEIPHNIRCSSFFELFNGDIDEITIQDLKRFGL